jgi:hypothetical protein
VIINLARKWPCSHLTQILFRYTLLLVFVLVLVCCQTCARVTYSKANSPWQASTLLICSTTVSITSRCRVIAILTNCQLSLVPKLSDRCLELTINRPTSQLFVVKEKKICKEQSFVCIDFLSQMCSGTNQFCFSNHEGNRCLRILASVFVERYSRADRKTSKSAVVFNIVTRIRRMGGHFCKYENGVWFEVGDRCARGKVSSLLRDMLHTQYRSSAKAKIFRRRARNRNETQTEHDGQQLVDGSGGLSEDDSSITSSDWGSSLDFQGFESLTGDDLFDIAIF